MFDALQKFLTPDKVSFSEFNGATSSRLIVLLDKSEELLQYGLIVLWEMLEYLTLQMEGHEAELFTTLLMVRYSNKQTVSQYASYLEIY